LYWLNKNLSDALTTYEQALKLEPASPQQKLRVMLTLAERIPYYGGHQRALELYQAVLRDFPDYPDKLGLARKMLPLAKRLGHKDDITRIENEIRRLTPPEAVGK
jgi:tetratricopeptide (TPR) repeat protein